MSFFVGHSLSAIAIYFSQQRDRRSRYRLFWLIWLIIIASSPDIDYFIPAFYSSANQGLRITHSLLFITILPGCIIFSLKFLQFKQYNLKKLFISSFLAGLSHLILDLLVGVTSLPLLWPFNSHKFLLPFGILPSAGKLTLSNYYLYRNLSIELGVILPLVISTYLISTRSSRKNKYKSIVCGLILCSTGFMYWSYTLPR
jgi:membrane-bound metal-dependent hydrolase YbcI (DUF457 family)